MEILTQYKNWLLAKQYSDKTIRCYGMRVERYLKHFPDPAGIKQEHIQTYLLDLYSNGNSRTTMEGVFFTLKNFYNFLAISGHGGLQLNENPLKYLMPVKREKRIPKIIPEDDLSAMLRAPDLKTVRGCRDYVIMLFLLHGLRAEELCNLDIEDIFEDGWGASRRMFINVKGKGRKERRVTVEQKGPTKWAWGRYMEKRNGQGSQIAFPAIIGKHFKRITPNGLYKLLARYGTKLRIEHVNPHLWRHTTAVKLIEDGVSIKEVQIRLGHETVATTEKYVQAAAILQENAANSTWIARIKQAGDRFRRWRN